MSAPDSMADELNKIQIEQLHRATLNISNNSLEIKKLCITVESSALTLIVGLYRESAFNEQAPILMTFGILIPVLFFVVDIILYYLQDRLRQRMEEEENEIRKRYQLPLRTVYTSTDKEGDVNDKGDTGKKQKRKKRPRWLKSIFNGSQIMYPVLILLVIAAPFIFRLVSILFKKVV